MFTADCRLAKAVSAPAPTPAANIVRKRIGSLSLVEVQGRPAGELHITIKPDRGESADSLARRLAVELVARDAEPVRIIGFGVRSAYGTTVNALQSVLGEQELPVTWVEGCSVNGHPLAGIQAHAVTGTEVRHLGAGASGMQARAWRDAAASHCVVSVTVDLEGARSSCDQAGDFFVALQSGLSQAGMTMKDVVRTWFYLDDILDWYGEFNRVRNDFFAQHELRPGTLPASTGVSGRNPAGSAICAVAWAMKPHDAVAVAAHPVVSPLQCAAPAYGSAFSRAMEIKANGYRQLLVSGTASIAPDGRTQHVGDVAAQIELTMQVVEAILNSRGMALADVCRATAYFKSAADAPQFDDWLAQRQLQLIPLVKACCEICRDDLLFEIELDAIG